MRQHSAKVPDHRILRDLLQNCRTICAAAKVAASQKAAWNDPSSGSAGRFGYLIAGTRSPLIRYHSGSQISAHQEVKHEKVPVLIRWGDPLDCIRHPDVCRKRSV
jgi:hypothetical protein